MPAKVITEILDKYATAPKSNASYLAIEKALSDINEGRTLEVPRRLRNIKLRTSNKEDGADDKYVYPHDHEGHFVEQEYMPTSNVYYRPSGQGYEETIERRMKKWQRLAKGDSPQKEKNDGSQS